MKTHSHTVIRPYHLSTFLLLGIAAIGIPSSTALAAHDYMELKTLVLIYPDYEYEYLGTDYDFHATSAQISQIKESVENNVEYYWRASHCRLHVKPTYHVMRDPNSAYGYPNDADLLPGIYRALDFDQIHDMGSSKYWLRFWSADGTHSVQKDVEDLGYEEAEFGSVIVFFAFERHPGINAYGGGAAAWPYRDGEVASDPCMLSSAAYLASEIQDDWLSRENGTMQAGVMQHEFSHNLDQIFAANNMTTGDGSDVIPYHGDAQYLMPDHYDVHAEFQYLCMTQITDAEWLDLNWFWATEKSATDADSDGVPDSGDLPITEATLGTSTASSDSDSDGMTDLEEVVYNAHYGVFESTIVTGPSPYAMDPADDDTDGDGVDDGDDPNPLVAGGDQEIPNAAPTLPLDGVISVGEYAVLATFDNSSDLSGTIYGTWANNGSEDVLYLAMDIHDDAIFFNYIDPRYDDHIKVRIDLDNDGWVCGGIYNYEIDVAPDYDNDPAEYVVSQHYRYYSGGSWHEEEEMSPTPSLPSITNHVSATNYIIEIAIPESELPGADFGTNMKLSLSFAVADIEAYQGDRHIFEVMTGLWDTIYDFSVYAMDGPGGVYDLTPPSPGAASFSSDPTSASSTSVTMTATQLSDASGTVEYYFEELTDEPGADDSGWQSSRTYVDTGLTTSEEYRYRVLARDAFHNVTVASEVVPAIPGGTYTPPTDVRPTPLVSSFSVEPYATNSTTVTMTATTATGPWIMYYFDEVSNNPGGDDSGWISSSSYTDTGLTPGLEYEYVVLTRTGGVAEKYSYASSIKSVTPVTTVTLLEDDFESGLGNWSNGGWYNMSNWHYHSSNTAPFAWFSSNYLRTGDLDTSSASEITIQFWYNDVGVGSGEVKLQIYDGSNYDDLADLGSGTENTWIKYEETIYNTGADTVYFRSDFKVNFVSDISSYSDYFFIDDVLITATN